MALTEATKEVLQRQADYLNRRVRKYLKGSKKGIVQKWTPDDAVCIMNLIGCFSVEKWALEGIEGFNYGLLEKSKKAKRVIRGISQTQSYMKTVKKKVIRRGRIFPNE